MTMKGIDVSSWNGWPFNAATENAYIQSDFIIVKATEGTGYVNPYCDQAVQRAKADGKPWGFYHYANGLDAVAEADYFYENCKNYFGEGIPCLDWELGSNLKWGDASWCRKFVDRVHERSGVWCMVYVQASAVDQCASCAKDCALWIAGYPDLRDNFNVPAFNYGTGAWPTYTVWQFTSGGGVDRNTAQLDADGWRRIATAGGNVAKPTKPSKKKSVTAIAREVIAGKWGNGEARKKKLAKAGYDYNKVQAKVNELMGAKGVDDIAREVIRGEWGNGDERRRRLEAAGYNYDAVQNRVNELM